MLADLNLHSISRPFWDAAQHVDLEALPMRGQESRANGGDGSASVGDYARHTVDLEETHSLISTTVGREVIEEC